MAAADGVSLAAAAAETEIEPAVLANAVRRGIINAWTESGVQYVSRSEVAVYAAQYKELAPMLDGEWRTASDAVSGQYRKAYIRLR